MRHIQSVSRARPGRRRRRAAGSAGPCPARAYDLVLRGGRVLDGMGNPWIRADVAISRGPHRRRRPGDRPRPPGTRRHRPLRVARLDRHDGPVGRRAAPERPRREQAADGRDDRDWRRGRHAGAGRGRWPSISPTLERQGISLNFGSYYSEAQARTAVLGNTARAPSAEELVRIQALMETAMTAGAMGMTTALIYPPGSFASTDELVEVAKVAARHGGIYATHMRDEGRDLADGGGRGHRHRRAGRPAGGDLPPQGGLPARLGHADVAGRRASSRPRGRAAWTWPPTSTCTRPAAPDSRRRFPPGRRKAAARALIERLADPAIRARLKREIASGLPGWSNMVEAAGGWTGIVLSNAQNAETRPLRGPVARRDRPAVGQGAGRRGLRSRRAGQRPRDGDLPHDERARRRDGAALSVDEHRQRCRRGRRATAGRTRPG